MRFYPHPFSREETVGWIERNRRRYEEDRFGLWAIVLKDEGTFAGDCGLTFQQVDGRQELEVGYHVNRSLWRRGIATEAAEACRDHAFDTLGYDRLIALIRPDNLASQGVARNIGMRPERRTEHARLPHLVFAMTPQDR